MTRLFMMKKPPFFTVKSFFGGFLFRVNNLTALKGFFSYEFYNFIAIFRISDKNHMRDA